ncbi:hypothetical protein A2230_02680 [candidate division WOR-1 bacterium RIFOXYA2_FULL_36_21]|uniref:Uncharacterized protein n=1 Tax=candidate division WOR-1 bacterium RIFOXYB2_FULL_36_35 TaxID=1802578 RepID=A0A1F4RXG2_UNCSA|nr:MAG: hypothetical protein A2230_02680 [candidate division WOR-1 bacterium RIFOXYA2_FULL_36_21]OGC12861.1 MAG: hypothetical protein A2290_02730 [candidate division WOR-1 bacterium RIFOXYB2_FULL_36_35]OGC19933.1 MAG: hypothetical protein A2282_02680 [candidate division WOR-1 bacterium RIFOXYA12_FULL_36_13]
MRNIAEIPRKNNRNTVTSVGLPSYQKIFDRISEGKSCSSYHSFNGGLEYGVVQIEIGGKIGGFISSFRRDPVGIRRKYELGNVPLPELVFGLSNCFKRYKPGNYYIPINILTASIAVGFSDIMQQSVISEDDAVKLASFVFGLAQAEKKAIAFGSPRAGEIFNSEEQAFYLLANLRVNSDFDKGKVAGYIIARIYSHLTAAEVNCLGRQEDWFTGSVANHDLLLYDLMSSSGRVALRHFNETQIFREADAGIVANNVCSQADFMAGVISSLIRVFPAPLRINTEAEKIIFFGVPLALSFLFSSREFKSEQLKEREIKYFISEFANNFPSVDATVLTAAFNAGVLQPILTCNQKREAPNDQKRIPVYFFHNGSSWFDKNP